MDKHRFPQLFKENSPVDSGSERLLVSSERLPALIRDAGEQAQRRFLEFFTAHIRNPGTRAVYGRAVGRFCEWCEQRGVSLQQVSPFLVAAYIEQLSQLRKAPTVKLQLAAIACCATGWSSVRCCR